MRLNEQQFEEALQYLEESLQPQFKTPEELYSWMRKNIKYGGPYDIIRGPENLLKNKKGQCHEQSMFAYKYLKQMGLNPQYHFVYNLDKDKQYVDGMGATHAFVTYKKDNKVYWFETAWNGQYGIHKYTNFSEMKNDVLKKLMQTSREEIQYYGWVDGLKGKPGMDIWDFCLEYIPDVALKKMNNLTESINLNSLLDDLNSKDYGDVDKNLNKLERKREGYAHPDAIIQSPEQVDKSGVVHCIEKAIYIQRKTKKDGFFLSMLNNKSRFGHTIFVIEENGKYIVLDWNGKKEFKSYENILDYYRKKYCNGNDFDVIYRNRNIDFVIGTKTKDFWRIMKEKSK